MKVLGIIPARYGSTRFPGKPLVDINGKPMIQWVYEAGKKALEHVVVATDDERILTIVKNFGGEAVMTSSAHETGTNRCLEALKVYESKKELSFDFVINIQGDEPMLKAEQISQLLSCFSLADTKMATLIYPVTSGKELEAANDVYVVFTKQMKALYFSRSPIPHVRGVEIENWVKHHKFHKHIGMYGYTPEALAEFASMQKTSLEKAESLEQNRWLENGGEIQLAITNTQNLSVDTPQDLEAVKKALDAH